jgi:type I restriction enzyme R subunit
LTIALSSEAFLRDTPADLQATYTRDLKFFERLRACVRLRYAERVDFSQYEPKIRKLLDQYVGADAVAQITDPVDIFDQDAFTAEVERVTGDAAKADTIAHRAERACFEHMQEDPAFYRKFSDMLREAIEAFRLDRLKAAEYLKRVQEIAGKIVNHTDESIPPALRHRDVAQAYFGCVNAVLTAACPDGCDAARVGAEAALVIDDMINRMRIVDWGGNADVQNQMRFEIEDALFDLKAKHGLALTFEQIDHIIEECLKVAKVRVP